jgi:hypothetical protein
VTTSGSASFARDGAHALPRCCRIRGAASTRNAPQANLGELQVVCPEMELGLARFEIVGAGTHRVEVDVTPPHRAGVAIDNLDVG